MLGAFLHTGTQTITPFGLLAMHGHHGGPGRGRGRGERGWGPPWAAADPFGFGGFGGGSGGGERRGRARRGDIRDGVLLLLLDGPKHGYQLMSELAERSGGRWTPGPGSIYPVVRALAHAGLVTVEHSEGRRTVSLTDDGRTVAERRRAAGAPPWEQTAADASSADDTASAADKLRDAAMRLLPTLRQLATTGSPAAIAAVAGRLDDLRRDIHRLLADDPGPDEAGSDGPGPEAQPTSHDPSSEPTSG